MILPAVRKLLLALCLVTASTSAQADGPVTVFAAASLKTALDDIAARFAETGVKTRISYGGSSTLARQIQYGAPADLFLSANAEWMDRLEVEGLIEPGTRRDLLTNRLVLIAAPDVDDEIVIAPGFDLLGLLGDRRLAMALVDAVPAGLYGRAALQHLGVWEALSDRVAQADNVRAALMLVATGEAPFGIVYATDAEADPRVRVVGTFPEDSHPPIIYPVALVTGRATPDASALLAYLRGPEAAAILHSHGFGLASESGG
jgi:molybdate transport system substrate-binding protein